MSRIVSWAIYALLLATASLSAAEPDAWKMAESPLMTRWANEVGPDNVLKEYPRPQMVRDGWTNLNGLWQYAIRPKDEKGPDNWDGRILVPFAIESALSGVKKQVGPDNRLWYRCKFNQKRLADSRLLLHFGAVDWRCEAWLNGNMLGKHEGGYDPFTFDITDALDEDGEQELVVAVWDPTDAGFQARGKQVREPRGIWYTSVTGVWQTVWLEQVGETYIRGYKATPDVDAGKVTIEVEIGGAKTPCQVVAQTPDEAKASAKFGGGETTVRLELAVENPKLWSPQQPHLYDLSISLAGGADDEVGGYFAMRKVEIKQAPDGFNRIFLNGEPVFLYGPLDQGWWPDGLYTAPTDEALKFDIEMTKKLGMNMARKHVKVEPARWYYWCDRLGLLVWQDMPNGDRHINADQPDIQRSAQSEAAFRREWQAIIDANYNFPCIIAWVPFNEGWGQFKTNEILAWTKQLDPTRLVDGPSGWTDRGQGDMHDMHRYPGPAMPEPEADRAVVLGEFGGLGWPVEDHLWWNKRNWGYRTYDNQAELQRQYELLMVKLPPLIRRGLAAAIYTQTTDVEGEVNGLITYDRHIVKLNAQRLARLHQQFYKPPRKTKTVVVAPTSEKQPVKWSYTTVKPDVGWENRQFDDAKWQTGPGGFGTRQTPGAVVRTTWDARQIWLRRTIRIDDPQKLQMPLLRIHHDEEAEVYINGVLAARFDGFVTEYFEYEIREAAVKALRKGENVIAVHCRQTIGGQYIDVGLLDLAEEE